MDFRIILPGFSIFFQIQTLNVKTNPECREKFYFHINFPLSQSLLGFAGNARTCSVRALVADGFELAHEISNA